MIESGKVVVTFESADLSPKTKSYGVTISMKLLWQYFRMVRFVFQHSKKLKFAQFCWILTLATIWIERVKTSHGNLAMDSTIVVSVLVCLFVCLFVRIFASQQYAGRVWHENPVHDLVHHESLRNSVVRAPYGRLGSHGFESHQALRWFFSSCIVKSFLAYLCASFSAPEKVSRSRAVSLVCLLDGTKTMTGFLGECFTIDWYIGFVMAIKRDAVWVMLKPWYKR